MKKFKRDNVLSVCSYSEFEPISFDHGKGYEADLLRAVAKDWGVKIEFHPHKDYEGIWLLPTENNSPYDMAIGGITPDKSRIEEGAAFSIPTVKFSQSLLVRKEDHDKGRIIGFKSFNNSGMKIGVVPDTTGEAHAKTLAKEHDISTEILLSFNSEAELLPALKAKKIDAIARGEIGNKLQSAKDPDYYTIITKDFGESFAIAVDASNKQLLIYLNQTLEKLLKQDAFIFEKWFERYIGS
jgi:ABC-type amino acid transport substrate-binding protein